MKWTRHIETPVGPLFFTYNRAYEAITDITWMQATACQSSAETKIPKSVAATLHLVAKELREYCLGERRTFTFAYYFKGTPFQERVWQALCEIPYGTTCSYKDIATQIGQPTAVRAVGGANHRNPLAIVIPCHRVIAANGALGGYADGPTYKKFLLDLEAHST